MANFFRGMASDGLSERGFPSSSRSSVSSLRLQNNINMTKNSNVPVITTFDHDATISPLSKEIDNRLKVLSKILPHNEVVLLSNDIINRLNSACYDKIAETVCSNSAAPSIYSRANSVCGSLVSQNKYPAYPHNLFHNGVGASSNKELTNKEQVTNAIFKAARKVRTQLDLGTISEEPHSGGLTVNSSRAKPKLKRPKGPTKLDADSSSQIEDDSMCFIKPKAPVRGQGRSTQKKSASQIMKINSKKTKPDDANISITKNSLRSNKKTSTSSNQKPEPSKRDKQKKIEITLDSSREESESEQQQKDEAALMERIQNGPKKTALSPFFGRFTKRCFANTSTPMKL